MISERCLDKNLIIVEHLDNLRIEYNEVLVDLFTCSFAIEMQEA